MIRVVNLYIQRADTQWMATSPDVPGYTAVAESESETRRLAREGLPFFLDVPATDVMIVEVGKVLLGTGCSLATGTEPIRSLDNNAEAPIRRGFPRVLAAS